MARIVQGTLVEIPFAIFDASNLPLDMTSSARSVVLRFKPTSGSVFTRTTGSAGQYSWTSQSNGTGKFLIPAATNIEANLPIGTYTVEAKYADTDSLDVKRVLEPETWTVVAPGTGLF